MTHPAHGSTSPRSERGIMNSGLLTCDSGPACMGSAADRCSPVAVWTDPPLARGEASRHSDIPEIDPAPKPMCHQSTSERRGGESWE